MSDKRLLELVVRRNELLKRGPLDITEDEIRELSQLCDELAPYNVVDKLLSLLAEAREALEFISCEGMDDGDFYAEEYVAEGTIAMANRARAALAKLS